MDLNALPLFRTQLGKRADGLLEIMDLFMRSHVPERGRADEGNSGVELGAAVIAIRRTSLQPSDAKTGRLPKQRKDR